MPVSNDLIDDSESFPYWERGLKSFYYAMISERGDVVPLLGT